MRITTKGQVTIPQAIRERLGLLPYSEVEFDVVGDSVRSELLASTLSPLPGLGVEIVLNVELQAGKACGAAKRRGLDAGCAAPLTCRCGIDRGQSSCGPGFVAAAAGLVGLSMLGGVRMKKA